MSIPSLSRSLLRYSIIALLLLISFFTFNRNGNPPDQKPINTIPTKSNHTVEKLIVVASQKEEDTSWLKKRLPQWSTAIYVVDDSTAKYQVPLNKGKEAMVYLTFLIDHYDNLPDITVFIHSLQYQWHNDDPNYDGATVLSRLQLPYVEAEGYVNLRCVWVLGCPEEMHPNVPITNKTLPAERVFKDSYIELFRGKDESVNDVVVPDAVGVSCCAQFAVSRYRVLARPKSDYERFRQWLIDTPLDDEVSGRVFEYSWHSKIQH